MRRLGHGAPEQRRSLHGRLGWGRFRVGGNLLAIAQDGFPQDTRVPAAPTGAAAIAGEGSFGLIRAPSGGSDVAGSQFIRSSDAAASFAAGAVPIRVCVLDAASNTGADLLTVSKETTPTTVGVVAALRPPSAPTTLGRRSPADPSEDRLLLLVE